MKVTVFEGTPNELAEVFPDYFNRTSTRPGPGRGQTEYETLPTDSAPRTALSPFVSREVATSFFRRIPLNEKQKHVFLLLKAANPKSLSSPVIYEKIGYGSSQFAGLMGALGRRLVSTPNYVKGTRLFIEVWDSQAFCMEYKLPEAVLEALADEKWAN